jgi:hypothetical protein
MKQEENMWKRRIINVYGNNRMPAFGLKAISIF